jgi:hypothetical protein
MFKMGNAEKIEVIYLKIFARNKKQSLGLYAIAAKLGYENKTLKITFIKELKQQIASCRDSMIELFGQEIINDIDSLDIKVRKLKRLSIFKNQPELAEY